MDDAALIDSLPQDPTELKRTILQLSQREKERTRERDDWQVKFQKVQAEKQEIEIARLRLEVELLRLKKWYYGRKADQLTTSEDVAQMLLGFATDLEARPVAQTITSTDNATPGSGTTLNQVQLTYNSFNQLTQEQQSHTGAVSGLTPSVQYGYDSGASSSNEIRLNQLTYPNGRQVNYNFASGMDATLNRVTSISDSSATLASYTYLGLGTVVRITYPQPSVWLDLWGGTTGTFAGLDRFNRIIDQRWQNNTTGTPADIDRYQYGYDRNSNRLWKANVVGTPIVSGGLDEFYSYDHLNRLTEMQRGTLNSGKTGITGTPSRQMNWTLDATGNWPAYATQTSGTTDLTQTRSSNTVNEITAISSTPAWATPPAYDAAGNMTSFPQPASPSSAFTAVYDAWNRMVSVSSGGSSVATYSYDGRGRRIVKVTTAISETRHFYYTDQWQDIEERVGTSTSMDQQYVWGMLYIDELACRDDATPQRLYACQDANFNLTAIASSSGSVVERYLFDLYGNRTIMNASWSVIGLSGYDWGVGHQGLVEDGETALIYNRFRVVHPMAGTFMARDPLGYINGKNLYEYEHSSPNCLLDPLGLATRYTTVCNCVDESTGQTMGLFRHSYNSKCDCDVANSICGRLSCAVLCAAFSLAYPFLPVIIDVPFWENALGLEYDTCMALRCHPEN